jgi:hypothetical protein
MKAVSFHFSNDPRSMKNQIFNPSFDINWSINETIKHVFENKGISVSTIDLNSPKEASFIFFYNMPYFWEWRAWRAILQSRKNNCLIVIEPMFVNPLNFINLLHRFFSVILTIDARMARKGGKYSHIVAYQSLHGIETQTKNFHDKKLLVMINANKEVFFPFRVFTLRNKELYAERIRFLNFSEEVPIEGFDLYGKGWNLPKRHSLKEKIFGYKKYKSYKGMVGDTDKIEVLSKYRFALCFENTIQSGSITEKIFDCFKARCIPIYWGEPDVAKFIPQACFIDFRRFESYSAMISFLQAMSEDEYTIYIKAIDNFLSDKITIDYWFEHGAAERLFKVCQEDWESKSGVVSL